MTKTRKRSKRTFDKPRKAETKEKINPFELKINRQKHNILGRKLSKHDVGMPGLSRYKAVQKRTDTLLMEYKKRWKSGRFVDKRIAENDPTLSLEDKMLKRFALEKQKNYDAAVEQPLNEEELTHYGQSLANIEKFDGTMVSSDEDDEDRGKISAKQVADEHFGGGTLSNPSAVEQGSKSWKERMEEVIMQSKKAKYERQMEKEKAMDLTQKLDNEWKELRSLISSASQKSKREAPEESKDPYDAMVRMLRYESRGHAADRLKSEEEIAKEEKMKLEKLEKDRLRRMKGIVDDTTSVEVKHRSADDLDEGLFQTSKERFHVSFKDGRLLSGGVAANTVQQTVIDDEDTVDRQNSSGEESEHGGDSSESEGGSDDGIGVDEDENDREQNLDDGGSSDETEPDNEEDQASADDSDGDSAEEDVADVLSDSEDDAAVPKVPDAVASRDHADFASELRQRKAIMDAARRELPYVFNVPSSYGELAALLSKYSAADQLTVLTRMRKCNHESLAEGNKDRLQTLFGLLLEYFGDVALQEPLPILLLDGLIVLISDLNKLNTTTAATHVLTTLSQRHILFKQYCQTHGGVAPWPRMDMLLYFKLVAVLYPTSDFYHPVVTPTILFMSQVFYQCPLRTFRDVVACLYLATVAYEYVAFAKRYCPELVYSLMNVLRLAVSKEDASEESMAGSVRMTSGDSILRPTNEVSDVPESSIALPLKRLGVKNNQPDVTDAEKLAAIQCCLDIIAKLTVIWKEVPAFKEAFSTIQRLCMKLSHLPLPSIVKTKLVSVIDMVEKLSSSPRTYMSFQKKKPKLLKTYEPAFEEIVDGKKKDKDRTFSDKNKQRAFNEKQRLIHKHKKELKGAMREVRKDSRFLSQHKLQEQLQRDAERKRKVKEIYQSLSQQEGEFRALKRGKSNKI